MKWGTIITQRAGPQRSNLRCRRRSTLSPASEIIVHQRRLEKKRNWMWGTTTRCELVFFFVLPVITVLTESDWHPAAPGPVILLVDLLKFLTETRGQRLRPFLFFQSILLENVDYHFFVEKRGLCVMELGSCIYHIKQRKWNVIGRNPSLGSPFCCMRVIDDPCKIQF